MATSLKDSRDKLFSSLLDLLWQQWAASGVSGSTAISDERVIDPEALLLVTSRFSRYEPRMLDGAIDWLKSNGSRINLQRLRRLHQEWPIADMRVMGAIASILEKHAVTRKWSTLADPLPDIRPEPLFIGKDGGYLPVWNANDPDFERQGLLRSPVVSRGTSRPPDPLQSKNLLYSLRALFGVNSRAEIMLWLLLHESGHPAAIARDTAYFPKSVQHTLNEMEDSGHIRSRRDGREKIFWLRQQDWSFLTGAGAASASPRWIDWMPLFSAVSTFIEGIDRPGFHEKAGQMQAIQLREILGQAQPALSRAGLAGRMASSTELKGDGLVRAIHADLEMISDFLREG